MEMEDLSIDITYDPVSFRWIVPLRVDLACGRLEVDSETTLRNVH
jgi:hypothetical protein